MLRYTGHPFVDVGVAAITAFAGKHWPDDVTDEDLGSVATYIASNYTRPPLSSALILSLMNSGFTQPAFDELKKLAYSNLVTKSLAAELHLSDDVCVFTGAPALSISLSLPREGRDAIPPGRAYRQHLPLLTGEGVINFSPNGDAGLPISGIALLALQFFPMGCAKCGIGLLAVHSDDDDLTLRITRRFWRENHNAVALAQQTGDTKLRGSPRSPKTLLVEALSEAQADRKRDDDSGMPASVTAYNFNGRNAEILIFHLPLEIINFLRAVGTSNYEPAWQRIVQRGWQHVAPAKAGQQAAEPRRNFLYEDLFTLPETAARFIRTYFLRVPRRNRFEDDPRSTYAFRSELDLVSWPLVQLFLRKVVHVEESRLMQIRSLGDGLANYVRRQGGGGKRFFRSFFTENNAANFRALLINANKRTITAGQPALFDLDSYIDVFEEGFEVMRPDWRLARDLVLMRMIDQLKDWLAQNPEAAPEIGPEADTADAATH